MPHVIVIDCDTTLMNSLQKSFINNMFIVWVSYNKNVRGRLKSAVRTK